MTQATLNAAITALDAILLIALIIALWRTAFSKPRPLKFERDEAQTKKEPPHERYRPF